MILVNRKYILLEMGTIELEPGYKVQARREAGNPNIVYVWTPGNDRATIWQVTDLVPDVQNQINNNLEYFEGTVVDAIRQRKVDTPLSGQRLFWIPEDKLPCLQAKTKWQLISGIYGEDELHRLLGSEWESEIEGYEVSLEQSNE